MWRRGKYWRPAGKVAGRVGSPRSRAAQRPFALSALTISLSLAGCTVGPDFERPPAPNVDGYTRGRMPTQTASATGAAGEAQRILRARDIPGAWWTIFQSRALKALIEEAIRNNYDL